MPDAKTLARRLTGYESAALVLWLLLIAQERPLLAGIVVVAGIVFEEIVRFVALTGKRPRPALAVPIAVEIAAWIGALAALEAWGLAGGGLVLAAGLWIEHSLVDALTRGMELSAAQVLQPKTFGISVLEALGGIVFMALFTGGTPLGLAAGIGAVVASSREEHERGILLAQQP